MLPTQNESRVRHGCLTTFLVLMIIANAGTVLTYTFGSALVRQTNPNMPSWALGVLTLGGLLNLVFAIALLKWKKFAFFGFVGTSVVVAFVNLASGLSIGSVILGLAGIGVLYWVLRMGTPDGWSQLE